MSSYQFGCMIVTENHATVSLVQIAPNKFKREEEEEEEEKNFKSTMLKDTNEKIMEHPGSNFRESIDPHLP